MVRIHSKSSIFISRLSVRFAPIVVLCCTLSRAKWAISTVRSRKMERSLFKAENNKLNGNGWDVAVREMGNLPFVLVEPAVDTFADLAGT